MFKVIRRATSIVVAILLVVAGLTAIAPSQPSQAAQNGKMFDPGLIMSDSVFFDFGTMTVAEIQRFLDSKVPICNANDGGPTCLRYYKQDTQAKAAEDGRCKALPAKKDQTAAQIIFDVANACGINPRVLIVLLQKEQGLIQASNPTGYMYRAATGYGCPDSKPEICGKGSVITGLFNQLHRAAGQFQWYGDPRGSFTYLKPGKNVSILYNPNTSCGKMTFPLKNQATANLYYYTPYTPNEIALKNLYGSGNSCSAYGNRNFWRFYSDWFGSPIGGGFLLKGSTPETYLIVDSQKYLIDDPELVASLAPLGPLGKISDAYLDSFADAGPVTRLVKSSTGALFLVDQGKKFTVAGCAVALTLGLECALAVTLTTNQLAALPNGGSATSLVVEPDGSRYLVDGGEKRQILDDASVTAANLKLPVKSSLRLSAFSHLPWGVPVAKPGTVFKNKTTGNPGVLVGGKFFELNTELAKEIDFSDWFAKSSGTLTAAGLSKVYSSETVGPYVKSTAGTFLLTQDGRRQLLKPAEVTPNPAIVNVEFTNQIPNAGPAISTPVLAQTSTGAVLLIAGNQKRLVASKTDVSLLKSRLGAPVTSFGATALAQLQEGPMVYAPGVTLRAKKSRTLYLVDAYTRLVSFSDENAFGLLKLRAPRVVADAAVTSYKQIKYSGRLVRCNGKAWMPHFGKLLEVETAAVSAWPGKPIAFSSANCSSFVYSEGSIAQLARDSKTKQGYYISAGKKRLITSSATYRELRGTGTGYIDVDPKLLQQIPTGPNAENKPPANTSKTYTVVAGDTLGGIAIKFKTTVAILKSLNRLTSDTIQVGQVLDVP
jgi:LysM repeat protein